MRSTFQRVACALTALSLTLILLPSARALPETEDAQALALQAVLDMDSGLRRAGYSPDALEALYANLSQQTLIRLSAQPLIPRLAEYVVLDYFHEDRLDRYAAYGGSHPDYPAQDVVTYVNIGMDLPRYSEYDIITDPDALDVLVNQYHSLGDNYKPEVVRLSSDYSQSGNDSLRPEAYQWFIRMANAARREGLTLRNVSAYRSYSTQQSLYNRYVSQDGVAAADRYSARPSFSEHQTGLALDINVAGSRYHFENTSEYQWLIDNCWDYGFILRYPADKTHITGYIYEPWHYRYVGIELAQQIRESGLTYDEFVARKPVEKARIEVSLPAVTVDGAPVEFSSLVAVDGVLYLSANQLADALGWPCYWFDESLYVSTPHAALSLCDPEAALTHACVVRGEELYMSLPDLARLLNITCLQADDRVLISSQPAPEGWMFTDVLPYSNWYDDVRFVWQEGLFSGTSADQFSPDTAMTRGMAVTVLRKLDRDAPPAQAVSFADVASHDWFADGVRWAASAGVVGGYPDGLFRPDQELTRQEAATILFAFARHMGCSTYSTALPANASDAGLVEDWAQGAFSWCFQKGLLTLRDGELLAPTAPITRAEMAHALRVLCQDFLN